MTNTAENPLFDLSLTDEQRMNRETMQRFAVAEIRDQAKVADEAGITPDDFYAKTAELGLALLPIPEALGGAGMDRSPVSNALIHEDLATGDMAMAGGREIFGFPKKMADISLLKEDGRFEGSLKRHGQRFFQVQADLAAPPNDEAFLTIFAGSMTADDNGNIRAVSYNFKHFMAPEGMGFDYHPRLVKQTTLLRPQTTKFGRAEVTLSPSDCDPWHEVEVVKLLGAVYTVGDNQMLAGEVMTEVEEMAFAPHAFLKWDA